MTKKIILLFLSFALATALIFTGCTPARRPNTNLNQNNGLGNTVGYQNKGTNLGTNNNMGNYRNTNNNTLSADRAATAVERIQGVRNATVVITGNAAYVGVVLDTNTTTGTTGTTGIRGTAGTTGTTGTTGITGTTGTTGITGTTGTTGKTGTTGITGTTGTTGMTGTTGITRTTGTTGTTGTTRTIGNQRDIKREIAQTVRATVSGINTVYVSTDTGFMDRLRTVGEGIRNGRAVNTFTTELNDMVRRITPTNF